MRTRCSLLLWTSLLYASCEGTIRVGNEACDQGAIAARCICGGSEQASGYCCGGAWQATECPSPGPVYALPDSRITAWNPGVPGGIPDTYTIHTIISNPAGDMRATIQDALDSAGAAAGPGSGRVVLLGAGVFNLSDTLTIPSYVVLRGAGLDANGNFLTQIGSVGPGFTLVMIGTDWVSQATSVNLATDAVKGTSSVTLSSGAAVAGFAAGQLVWLDETTDGVISQWSPDFPDGSESRGWYSRLNRPIGEVLEVDSVSGSTVTFKTPIHIAIRTAQSAQLTRFTNTPTRLAGIEELRLTTGYNGSGDYGYDRGNIILGFAIDCWAKHFEADGSAGKSVGMRLAHRCEVRQGYVHDTQYYQNGGWGYGFDLTHGSSNNLIEDCISIRFNKVVNFRGAGGGNVVGYNYMDDGAISWNQGWIETGLQASHYPTPHFELFEGNYSFNADGDNTSGNAVHITFFRNHLSGKRAQTRRPTPNIYGTEDPVLVDTGNVRCAGAMSGHKWYNFVGNVLGIPAMAGFEYQAAPPDMLADAVWRIGSFSDWSTQDAEVVSTMIRDGNWDYLTNSVHWHGLGAAGSAPATLPDSLYRSGKPAFFGSNRWPWVDPLGSTKTYTLPAKARYDAGRPNLAD